MKFIKKYYAVIFIGIIAVLWLLTPRVVNFIYFHWYKFEAIDHLGQMGDVFGFSSSLLSLMAFAFLFYTYLKQTKDSEEDKAERNLFNLLNAHNELVKSISAVENIGSVTERTPVLCYGKVALSIFVDMLHAEFNRFTGDYNKVEQILEYYENYYTKKGAFLGHYFRSLYHILKYLDELKINIELKSNLIKIVRSQLSVAELRLLYFNGLSNHGNKKFKPIIEKYSILEDLPLQGKYFSKIIEYKRNHYNPSAFGDN
jgi:hypothetical protein